MMTKWKVLCLLSIVVAVCLVLLILDSYTIFPIFILFFATPLSLIILRDAIRISIRENQWPKIYLSLIGSVFFGLLIFYLFHEWDFLGTKVLKAEFIDDLSRVDLTLWENGKFRAESGYMFGGDRYEGNYRIEGNQIKFNKNPVENDFIPMTLSISGDKIYFREDSSFYYFKITRNLLKQ